VGRASRLGGRTSAQDDWLRIAADCEGAAGVWLDLPNADLSNGSAELFLNTGAVPAPGGTFESELVTRVLAGECVNVTSTRSFPAQIASALSPTVYFTTSSNSFVELEAGTKQRRLDAINALRKGGSTLAAVAKERAFKVGQKGSTFPWANSATALFEAMGRSWLASEIAIIGAASEHLLGSAKHPDNAAFGDRAHPAELLAQTRHNAGDASWWREQLNAANDEGSKAEWALALWAVAAGPVIDDLLHEWQQVVDQLTEARRNVLMRSAAQIAQFGCLRKRPVTESSENEKTKTLIALRVPTPPARTGERPVAEAGRRGLSSGKQEDLLAAARAGKWLQVDSLAVYR
jgi:hypothetical protein